MPTSHHAYFEQVLRKVESIDPETIAAIVSSEGLVLISNIPDEHREAQWASYAANYVDNGRKMFSTRETPGDKEPREDVQSIITVGHSDFIILAELVAGAVLVMSGKDKSRISTFLKTAMEEVSRVNRMLKNNEIMF